MELELKETAEIVESHKRKSWVDDPEIRQYIYFKESSGNSDYSTSLTNFHIYFELYNHNNLVGDIKIFYENEEDILHKRAQILMVIGDRNQGIGTMAIGLLLEKLKDNYNSVYCNIMRSNIASLKILKKNGFHVDYIDEDTVSLSRNLD